MNISQQGEQRDNSKCLILITGPPASGKSYLSQKIQQTLAIDNINSRIISIDKLQAILNLSEISTKLQLSQIISQLTKQQTFFTKIKQTELNKTQFNPETWKIARLIAENKQFINYCLQGVQILIIQDQMPLKSQRKPYRRYCFDSHTLFLEICLILSQQQLIQSNSKRSQYERVSIDIIKKSANKFQLNQYSLIIKDRKYIEELLVNSQLIMKKMQKVVIYDNNNSEDKKSETSENQMDQNQLRKYISRLINQEEYSKEFFSSDFDKKKKAKVLSDAKKIYIERKRLQSFTSILKNCIKQT